MLVIPLDRLAFILAKAREFDAEVPIEPDAATGSDPPDDDERIRVCAPVTGAQARLKERV